MVELFCGGLVVSGEGAECGVELGGTLLSVNLLLLVILAPQLLVVLVLDLPGHWLRVN